MLLTPAAYAKRRGVSREAVRKAVAQGRITLTRGKLDPSKADKEWSSRSHPGRHGGKRQPRATSSRSNGGQSGADSYAAMRARREQAQAELAELDLARRRGEVAPVAAMRDAFFALNRRARDMLLALPDRLAPRLAMLDQVEISTILSEEIRRVCGEIADSRPL